ncbi:hypothetical protein [Nocardioides jiangxiensis]|uniref:Lipoprotein n=1 Tax=Nocardioides jiangxiensis TaxID=3064524 RepID=A0ABT9AZ00_9ACTN|nr:hypothetical protein [Nocardioides sp. WY-20]MDO7867814.1 hypothetical protein [Nocardioides sp. WY-20]
MIRPRIAAAAVLALTLVGCASEAPPAEPEVVPTTLAAQPKPKPQPKAHIVVDAAPARLLNGYASSSADAAWQMSLDYVRDWLFNPVLMQQHVVKDVHELDGLADEMTPAGAARWLPAAHKALRRYTIKPWETFRKNKKAEAEVAQLALWNLDLSNQRGWDNPMLGTVHVSDAKIIGADGLGVIMRLKTRMRFIGQGNHYAIPYETVLTLVWHSSEGTWKLDAWQRVGRVEAERIVGKGATPSAGESPSPRATDTDGASPQPTDGPTLDPSLAPD